MSQTPTLPYAPHASWAQRPGDHAPADEPAQQWEPVQQWPEAWAQEWGRQPTQSWSWEDVRPPEEPWTQQSAQQSAQQPTQHVPRQSAQQPTRQLTQQWTQQGTYQGSQQWTPQGAAHWAQQGTHQGTQQWGQSPARSWAWAGEPEPAQLWSPWSPSTAEGGDGAGQLAGHRLRPGPAETPEPTIPLPRFDVPPVCPPTVSLDTSPVASPVVSPGAPEAPCGPAPVPVPYAVGGAYVLPHTPAGHPTAGRAHRRAGGARRAGAQSQGGEAWRRLVPQAAVVAVLAGGTSAFVAHDKAVELDVDGQRHSLHTFAGSVSQLLADEGVRPGGHDAVEPGRDARLAHGDTVTVRSGRPLRLTLDGRAHRVWTTAGTVGGALRELGVRAAGARISAPLTARVPRSGRELEVWTERTVGVLADGRERRVRTTAETVGELLRAAGVRLRGEDTASVPLDSFPREGQTVTVMRITGGEQIREEHIPFTTVHREDPRLRKGTQVIAQRGRPGLRRITYALRTVNGVRMKPRRTGAEVLREPRTQVVRVGTRTGPPPVAGAEGLDWSALARCESGGRPDAVDSSGTYGGLYQFDARTWRGLGGSGRPQDAPAAEQTYRAKKLYVARGASPWPVCGRKLSR